MIEGKNLDILLSKDDGSLLIVNYGIDRRYDLRMACGPPVPVTVEEMRKSGLGIVLFNLADFFERDPVADSYWRDRPAGENQKLFRRNYIVGVCLTEHTLLLSPMKRLRGGHEGITELAVGVGSGNASFFSVLMQAVSICKGPRHESTG
jgi:hypothetical protein